MKTTMRQLRPWTSQWTPPELCGGVPNKGIDSVHALLFSDLEACKEARSHFVGCKADVRKRFDSVAPAIAFSTWLFKSTKVVGRAGTPCRPTHG